MSEKPYCLHKYEFLVCHIEVNSVEDNFCVLKIYAEERAQCIWQYFWDPRFQCSWKPVRIWTRCRTKSCKIISKATKVQLLKFFCCLNGILVLKILLNLRFIWVILLMRCSWTNSVHICLISVQFIWKRFFHSETICFIWKVEP